MIVAEAPDTMGGTPECIRAARASAKKALAATRETPIDASWTLNGTVSKTKGKTRPGRLTQTELRYRKRK